MRNRSIKLSQKERDEKQVLPTGCHGRVSTSAEANRIEDGNGYRVTTHLGCAGLKELVRVNAIAHNYVEPYDLSSLESDVMLNSAAQILDACAGCLISLEGQKRADALAKESFTDNLTLELSIAEANRDAKIAEQAVAEATRAAAQANLEVARLNQHNI